MQSQSRRLILFLSLVALVAGCAKKNDDHAAGGGSSAEGAKATAQSGTGQNTHQDSHANQGLDQSSGSGSGLSATDEAINGALAAITGAAPAVAQNLNPNAVRVLAHPSPTDEQIAANDAIARDFAQRFCSKRNSLPQATRVTIERMLAEVNETNCFIAGVFLGMKTQLDLSTPATGRIKKIKDLRPLSVLTNLRELSLRNNLIENVDDLAPLVHLERLDVSHNKLKSTSGFQYLQRLKALDLSSCGLKNGLLRSVRELELLNSLDLSHNELTELPMMPQRLANLNARTNLLENIERDLNLPALKSLDLSDNHLKHITGVEYARSLEILNIEKNALTRGAIRSLMNLARLKKIAVSRAGSHDIDVESEVGELKMAIPGLEVAPGISVPMTTED